MPDDVRLSRRCGRRRRPRCSTATPALDPATAARLAVETPPELVAGAGAGGGARALGGDRADARVARTPRRRRGRCRAGWRGFHAAGLVPRHRRAALRLSRDHAAGAAAAVRRALLPRRCRRRSPAARDDFAGAGDELAHLQWLDAAGGAGAAAAVHHRGGARRELEALLGDRRAAGARPVPFFRQGAGRAGVPACSDP